LSSEWFEVDSFRFIYLSTSASSHSLQPFKLLLWARKSLVPVPLDSQVLGSARLSLKFRSISSPNFQDRYFVLLVLETIRSRLTRCWLHSIASITFYLTVLSRVKNRICAVLFRPFRTVASVLSCER